MLQLSGGIDANEVDGGAGRNTLLHWAASYSDVATVELLVSHGANVNATDANGVTPLHEALSRKCEGVAAALIGHGASLATAAVKGPMKDLTPMNVIRNSDHVWTSEFLGSLPLGNGAANGLSSDEEIPTTPAESPDVSLDMDIQVSLCLSFN